MTMDWISFTLGSLAASAVFGVALWIMDSQEWLCLGQMILARDRGWSWDK